MSYSWASVLAKHHILITNLVCLLAFTVQFGILLKSYITPEQTNIRVTEKNMSTFPLVFKICFSPGLNESAIKEAGYEGTWKYFRGKSKFNRSLVGWAGHTSTSGVRGSVQEMVEKAQLYTAEDVINNIHFSSRANKYINVNLKSVKVWRMNYPYNCFALDLTDYTEAQQQG